MIVSLIYKCSRNKNSLVNNIMTASIRLRTLLGHMGSRARSNHTLNDNLCSNGTKEFCTNTVQFNECSISQPIIQDKEFQYSLNGSLLSQEQRRFYEDNGYLVIKNLVNDNIIQICREHFVDVCNGAVPPQGMFLMKEPTLAKAGATGEHLYYKIQDLLYDDVFTQYTTLPELLDYVECFTGPNITAIHSMLINKPPDAKETTIHPLHQDLLYFPFRPADLIVGVWTAMEAVDTENGCLVVVPGSHKSGQLLAHGTEHFQTGPYKTFFGLKNKSSLEPIPLSMEKGDTVFLHPLLIHGSGPNSSKRFRKAISCHYAASECHVIDSQGTDHSIVARNFEASAQKASVPLDYKTIMKLRSVVVRGSAGFTEV